MKKLGIALVVLSSLALGSCAEHTAGRSGNYYYSYHDNSYYSDRLPQEVDTKEKMVLVDPNVNAWGAYENGRLVKGGIATAGGNWCDDIGRPCRTATGTFRIQSLGDANCKSKIYPKPHGGGLMPYCMFFNNGMALHGSPDGTVIEDNVSHGCVRMRIPDAEWLRNDFASVGTKVVVKSY
jgi:lipoprotein-anchoring transpeptidase ErfK/SrfK